MTTLLPDPFATTPAAVAVQTAVVFDIDGTLASASSVHLDALGYASRTVLDVTARFEMDGERPHLNGTPVSGWVDAQCFELLASHAGLEWDAVREDALDVYARRYTQLLAAGASPGVVIPGTVRMLDALTEAGIPLGLSTGNASAIARTKLAALGLADYFTFDPNAGFGDAHPHRSAVAAAAVAGVPDARTVYLVGDTVADMRAALDTGAHGIGVCTGAETGPTLLAAGAGTVLADAGELDGLLGLRTTRWFPHHVPGIASAADSWFDYR